MKNRTNFPQQNGIARRSESLAVGSARVSRAGCSVPLQRTSGTVDISPSLPALTRTKVRPGGTPRPARLRRALPGAREFTPRPVYVSKFGARWLWRFCICLFLLGCTLQAAPVKSKPVAPNVAKAAEAGLAAFAKNDFETARTQFNRLLELDPDNLTGLVNLGTVEYRLKHMPEAERLLKKAVRIEPEAALAWWTLGVVYCEQDKLDAALAALSQAVFLDPKNANAHNYLAVVIGKKGWTNGAELEFQRAIELAPDSAEAHFNLALLFIQRDPPAIELARRHYQKALDLGAAPDSLIEKALSASK